MPAVAKAYGGKRQIHWMEVYAGEKSTKIYGPDVWMPRKPWTPVREYVVSIKGPLTTPVGGGIAFASTSPCARNSTCMSACAPFSTSRACPAR